MSRRVGIVLASTCSDETAAAVSDLALLGRMASGEPSPAWASRGRLEQRRRHAQQRRRLQGGFRHRSGFATRQRARSCGSGSTPQTWVGTTCQSPTADSAASPRTEWITAGSQRAQSTARCRSEPTAMNPDPTVTEGDIARASALWGLREIDARCSLQDGEIAVASHADLPVMCPIRHQSRHLHSRRYRRILGVAVIVDRLRFVACLVIFVRTLRPDLPGPARLSLVRRVVGWREFPLG